MPDPALAPSGMTARLDGLLNEAVQVTDHHGRPTFRGVLVGYCLQPTLIIEDASGHRTSVGFGAVADVQAVAR